ncbi:MAG TPA: CBS domain-containing protein [Steroidobacteraceae bacterium]|nr:CBS domain-containing protein [Steroidobacteraceae bacterium]
MIALYTPSSMPAAILPQRVAIHSRPLSLHDPATAAMTDFTRDFPITVSDVEPIGSALADMIRFGVRSMLVTHGINVVGFITSYDIEGEKPMQFLQGSTYTRHHEIQVGDIMTPLSRVAALNWRTVRDADIEDLVDVFKHIKGSHVLVMESAGSTTYVRGIFSRTQLERQLRTILDH